MINKETTIKAMTMNPVESISSSVVPEDASDASDASSEFPSSFVFSSLFLPLELSGLFFLGVSCGLPEAIEGEAIEGDAIEGVAIEGVAVEGVAEPGVTDDVLGAGVGTVAGTVGVVVPLGADAGTGNGTGAGASCGVGAGTGAGAGVGAKDTVHSVLSPPPSHPAAQVHVYVFAPFVHVDAPPQLTPSHGAEVGQDRDPKPCA